MRPYKCVLALAALLLFGLVAIDFRTAAALGGQRAALLRGRREDAYAWLTGQGTGFRIWEYSDLYDDAEFLHTFSLAYNHTPRFGGYYDNGAPRRQWQLYKWAKPERGATPADAAALGTALRLSSVRYVLVHRRLGTYDEALAMTQKMGLVRGVASRARHHSGRHGLAADGPGLWPGGVCNRRHWLTATSLRRLSAPTSHSSPARAPRQPGWPGERALLLLPPRWRRPSRAPRPSGSRCRRARPAPASWCWPNRGTRTGA